MADRLGSGLIAPMRTMAPAPLRTGGVILYSAGSIGTGLFSTVPTVLLLFYCTEILDLEPAAAATVILVPKLWSILWDPFVGLWSDRTNTRFGRRRPFLVGGSVGVAVAFVALFSAPDLPAPALTLWIGGSYFALATLYSIFAVPYVAIPGEIGKTADERSRLVQWRIAVTMVGVLLGAAGVPLIVEASGGGRAGYATMSLIVAMVCVIAMAGPVAMLGSRDNRVAVDAARLPAWRQLSSGLSNRPFLMLGLAYLLQLAAAGMISAAAPYLVVKVLGLTEEDVGFAMLAMLAATILAVPFWSWAGRRWGEMRTLTIAVLAYAVTAVMLGFFAAHTGWPASLVLFALAGVPFAGLQLLPFTLFAHFVHRLGKTETRNEALFTGIWTAFEKLGLAIGPALTGLVLIWAPAIRGGYFAPAVATGAASLLLLSLPLLALVRTGGHLVSKEER